MRFLLHNFLNNVHKTKKLSPEAIAVRDQLMSADEPATDAFSRSTDCLRSKSVLM